MIVMNDQVREAIRVQLAKKDITQAELARKAGVSKQYIHKLIRGKTGNPSESWSKVFDILDLELVAKPKEPENVN